MTDDTIFSSIQGASVVDEGSSLVVSMPPATSGSSSSTAALILLFLFGPFAALPLLGGITMFSTSVALSLWLLAIAAAALVGVGRAVARVERIVRVDVEPTRLALVTRPLGVQVRHWLRAGDLRFVTAGVQPRWTMTRGRRGSVQRKPLGLVEVGGRFFTQRFTVDPAEVAAPLAAALAAWRDGQPGRARSKTGPGCIATLVLLGAAVVATGVKVSGARLFPRPIEDVLADAGRSDVTAMYRGKAELEGRGEEAAAFARSAITGPAPGARRAVVAAALFEPELLFQALGHPDARVREDAARALENCIPHLRGSAPALARCLSDPDPTTRAAIANALWRITSKGEPVEVVTALVGALGDPEVAVADGAAGALRRIGPDAIAALSSAAAAGGASAERARATIAAIESRR